MASSARRRIKSVSYARYGYFFIIPFFIVYAIFMFLPLVNTFILSTKGNGDYVAWFGRGDSNSTCINQERFNKGRVEVTTVTRAGKEETVYMFYEPSENGAEKKVGYITASVFGHANFDFVGTENFNQIFTKGSTHNQEFFNALKNTLILWVGNFIPQIILSLALAVWFTDARLKIPGKGFFKIVMYMPNIITAASVATLFLGLTSIDGPINSILKSLFGMSKLDFRGNESAPWLARGTVMFIQTWMWFGNTMIMLMSGIMGINPSLFEAAEIDGASGSQTFWRITMPLLSPILVYTVVTSMIGGLQMYDIPFLYKDPGLVNGLPHIRTVAVYIFNQYRTSITDTDRSSGFASAASVILFVITSMLGAIIFRMNRDQDEVAKRKQRKKLIKQEKAKTKQFGGLSI